MVMLFGMQIERGRGMRDLKKADQDQAGVLKSWPEVMQVLGLYDSVSTLKSK